LSKCAKGRPNLKTQGRKTGLKETSTKKEFSDSRLHLKQGSSERRERRKRTAGVPARGGKKGTAGLPGGKTQRGNNYLSEIKAVLIYGRRAGTKSRVKSERDGRLV